MQNFLYFAKFHPIFPSFNLNFRRYKPNNTILVSILRYLVQMLRISDFSNLIFPTCFQIFGPVQISLKHPNFSNKFNSKIKVLLQFDPFFTGLSGDENPQRFSSSHCFGVRICAIQKHRGGLSNTNSVAEGWYFSNS